MSGPGPIIPGNLVYFKEIQTSSRPKNAVKAKFKGCGYGILLGYIPPFGKDRDLLGLISDLGAIGYVSFDDIAEFVSPEIGAEILKKFEEKYLKQAEVPPAPENPIGEAKVAAILDSVGMSDREGPRIVDRAGNPIAKDDE